MSALPDTSSVESDPHWWHRLMLLALAAVFGYAGWIKLIHPDDLSHVIARFDLLPPSMINALAIALPMIELLLAGSILIPSYRGPGLLGVMLTTAVFAIALSTAIARSIPIACGCFGGVEAPSPSGAWWALARDLALLFVAAFLYTRSQGTISSESTGPGPETSVSS